MESASARPNHVLERTRLTARRSALAVGLTRLGGGRWAQRGIECRAHVTLQPIFQQGYAAFAQGHALSGYVRKAAWAIMACRTAGLGGHVQRCPDGHFARVWYNSCRHRLCPQCTWL
jgi:hypothetical protein